MKQSTLEDRLYRIEKENKIFRRVLLGLAFTVGAISLVSAVSHQGPTDAHFRIVTASKFSLLDQRTGKVRAELSHQTMEGGWAGITLWDNKGRPRAEFKLWEDGSTRLAMMDAKRKELSSLTVDSEGETKLVVEGKKIK